MRGDHAFYYLSFKKTFTVSATFFPVTSPVSKTFAYLALVLRAQYAICRHMFTVGFQFNLRQIKLVFQQEDANT